MHSLLERQLLRHFPAGVPDHPALKPFFEAVDAAYCAADYERDLLGRALELMSAEQRQRYRDLAAELCSREQSVAELRESNRQLQTALTELQTAHRHVLQTDKMALVGPLAAGIAHEISNPVAVAHANLSSLCSGMQQLLQQVTVAAGPGGTPPEDADAQRLRACSEADWDWLRHDLPALLLQTRAAVDRTRAIVRDLR